MHKATILLYFTLVTLQITLPFSAKSQLVLQWETLLKKAQFPDFQPTHVKTDTYGNIIIAGTSTTQTATPYKTIKLNSSGQLLWSYNTNISAGNIHDLTDVYVSPWGSIYLSGAADLVKLNASGKEQWRKEGGSAIVADNMDNIYQSTEQEVIKYDSSGRKQWGIPKPNAHIKMAAGKAGKLYIIYGNTIALYDTKGDRIWQQVYSEVGKDWNQVLHIVSDHLGNAYAVGLSETNPSNELVVPMDSGPWEAYLVFTKFDDAGMRLWEHQIYQDYPTWTPSVLRYDGGQGLYINNLDQIISIDTSGKDRWRIAYDVYIDNLQNHLTTDKQGRSYLIDATREKEVTMFSPSGSRAWTHTTGNLLPGLVATDAHDNLYIMGIDTDEWRIQKYKAGTGFGDITFTLVDAAADKEIGQLKQGDTILLPATPFINIRANTNDSVTKSVQLTLSKNYWNEMHAQTENHAPYTLFGNRGNNYKKWKPKPDYYTLRTRAYSGKNASGIEGPQFTVEFHVIDPSVNSFTLMDAGTDQILYDPIQDGGVYYKSQLPPLVNIRANTYPESIIGSVKFRLNNWFKMENNAPFAIAANKGADFFGFDLKPGTYKLSARPFSGDRGTGYKMKPLTIYFTVIDDLVSPAHIAGKDKSASQYNTDIAYLRATPNPFSSATIITLLAPGNGYTTLRVFDTNGILVSQLYGGNTTKGQPISLQFNKGNLAAGMYTLQVATGPYIVTKKVIINP